MLSKVNGFFVSIAALCAACVLLGASLATATETPSPQTGTIHLVKYDQAEEETTPTGAEDQALPVGAKQLAGATFRLTAVLKTPQIENVAKLVVTTTDRESLLRLRASEAEAALTDAVAHPGANQDWTFGDSLEATTDDTGAIDWEDIPLGVYLLQETQVENPTGSYHRSPAALVFLPTPDPVTAPDNTGWIFEGEKYAAWIYPKNSLEENLKTVVDDGVKIGEKITYSVSLSVPAVHALSDKEKADLQTGREYDLSDFGMWDNLDKSLKFDPQDAGTITVSYGADISSAKPLAAGDFATAVLEDPADPAQRASGQEVVVALNATGLNKVAKAKKDDRETRVFITFMPTVKSGGMIPGKARAYKAQGVTKGLAETRADSSKQFPFNPPAGPDTFTTNTVVSAWGSLNVIATNTPQAGEQPLLLEDTTFELYKALENPDNWQLLDTGTTDENGKFTTTNFQAADLRDGKIRAHPVSYSLLETQAPVNYELQAEMVPVTLDAAKFNNEANWRIDDNGAVVFQPNEDPDNKELATQEDMNRWLGGKDVFIAHVEGVGSLPVTGGPGVAPFLLFGCMLLFAAEITKRRKA